MHGGLCEATEFEYRHRLLVHQLIVAAAFVSYLIQRDDIVWQLIKNSGEHRVLLERILFAIATLMVGTAAIACGRFGQVRQTFRGHPDLITSDNRQRLQYEGELLYAVGLGSLAPLSGFIILVGGESLRIFRLMGRDRALSRAGLLPRIALSPDQTGREALRAGFAKWGVFFTMLAFTITLKDRMAEALASVVFLVAIMLSLLPAVGSRKNKNLDEQRKE